MTSFRYLPVDDISIALRGIGAGEPVVMLHSSAGSSAQWREIAAELASSWRLYMPDLPGYGDSAPWRGRRARSLETDADIVAAVAAELGESVHLVGHSYGGAVALAAAVLHPRAVTSLTLIEPVAFHLFDDSEPESMREVRTLAQDVFEGLLCGGHHAAMESFVDYWNGSGTWRRLTTQRQDALACQIDRIAQEFQAVLSARFEPQDYACIDMPTAVVCGAASPAPARRVAALVAAVVPGAELHMVAAAGHMLPLTHTRETVVLIAGHLREATGLPLSFMPHVRAA